jgi:fucose 4-O-acetylase-like acetyltransferase
MTQLQSAPDQPPTPVAEGAAEAAVARPVRRRDPFFDNAKFLAILLVVIGHSLVGLREVGVARAAYFLIYLFHMPLFILVTGYLSRNFTFSGGKARKLIVQLGVPYLVFETLYSGYDALAGGNDFELSLLDPYYLTWFLLALFLWRLSTPVWQQIRWPLAVAVAISLLSYMTSLPGEMELHRVLGLLPFYVLGLVLRPAHFELLKHPIARVLGAVALIGALPVAFLVSPHLKASWLYWKNSHDSLGVGNVTGTAVRLGLLLIGVVLIAAFLAVVPRRHTWFTKLGATTLYAYLLHGFLVRILKYTGLGDLAFWHSIPGVAAMVVVAVCVGTLLCTQPVVRTLRWLLEPKLGWAFTGLRRPESG